MFNIKVPFVLASHAVKRAGTAAVSKSKAGPFGFNTSNSNKFWWKEGSTLRYGVSEDAAQTLTNKQISNGAPTDVTGSSVTLGATHVGKVTTLSRAGGIAVTLPAATGSGNRYELIVAVTFTGAASIAVASGTDYMVGVAQLGIDGGTFVPHQYPTANTGTVATESDTCSLFGTANSQGGFKGARIVLTDIAAAIWHVHYISDAGGTEANPFSAAV